VPIGQADAHGTDMFRRALLDHHSELANEACNLFQLGIVMAVNGVRKALNAFFVAGGCNHSGIE
jgi:hypothetical protein